MREIELEKLWKGKLVTEQYLDEIWKVPRELDFKKLMKRKLVTEPDLEKLWNTLGNIKPSYQKKLKLRELEKRN